MYHNITQKKKKDTISVSTEMHLSEKMFSLKLYLGIMCKRITTFMSVHFKRKKVPIIKQLHKCYKK